MATAAARIPAHVLTGFLGSGKTTLLNRLLQDPALGDCAVLINEFGAIGVDHHLVDRVEGDMVLLASGCICCTVRGDLAEALRALYARREAGTVPAFARVVIETTGLADPVPVLATLMFDRILQNHFAVGSVVTTIDALNGAANLQEFAVCRKQATSADLLVLTKLDLAEAQAGLRLRQELQALNPAAQVLRADAATDLAALLVTAPDPQSPAPGVALARSTAGSLRSSFFATGTTAETAPASTGIHGDIHSFVLQIPQAMDWTVFGIWLSLLLHAHGERVLRVKGLLQVQGAHTPVVVHGVQQLVYPPTHLARWPDGPRQSELVFIVRGLEQAAVEASLQSYLLRFA